MRCVFCGEKAHETGSATVTIRPKGSDRRALAHLNCYGSGQQERTWAHWVIARHAGYQGEEPAGRCPRALLPHVERARGLP